MSDDGVKLPEVLPAPLVPRPAAPVLSPEEAKEAMAQYLAVCEAVLDPVTDYQEFAQKKRKQVAGRWVDVTETRRFKKKSAVKKLQTYYGVGTNVRDIQRDDLGEGHFGFRMVGIATARDGRVVEAVGGCSTFEERFDIEPWANESESQFIRRQKKALARAYHDIMSTAETRATNRAVMNCIGVGGGEVTAEEMQASRPGTPPPEPATPAVPKPARRKAITAEGIQAAEAEQRERGRKSVMAVATQLEIPDTVRHRMAEIHFGKPSSNDLEYKQLRRLHHELQEYAKELQRDPQFVDNFEDWCAWRRDLYEQGDNAE